MGYLCCLLSLSLTADCWLLVVLLHHDAFAAGISFSASAPAWVTLTGLCLFMWSFSLGMGALTFLVAAEVRACLRVPAAQTKRRCCSCCRRCRCRPMFECWHVIVGALSPFPRIGCQMFACVAVMTSSFSCLSCLCTIRTISSVSGDRCEVTHRLRGALD